MTHGPTRNSPHRRPSGLKARILAVRVVRQKIWETRSCPEYAAPTRKGVAHHGPLRLAPEAKDLPEVVNEAREDEPAWMAVLADLLGRLEQMFELRKVRVRIAVIDQRVEKFQCLPHSHLAALTGKKLAPLFLDEIERLVAVIETIKLAHARSGGTFVIAELLLLLFGIRAEETFGIAFLEEILPLFEVGEWSIGGKSHF